MTTQNWMNDKKEIRKSLKRMLAGRYYTDVKVIQQNTEGEWEFTAKDIAGNTVTGFWVPMGKLEIQQ